MKKTELSGEELRLAALKEFHILDTLPEKEFDDITLLASQICETPVAAISLVDENRQWFKSSIGLKVTETPRDCAFCDHTIRQDGLLVVPDACADSRFAANPLVTGEPHIRFYAGAPLITSDGYRIGSLCVIDYKPREITETQVRSINALARSVMTLIEARASQASANLKEKRASNLKFSEIKGHDSREKSFFDRHIKQYVIATLVVTVVTISKFMIGEFLQIESPFLLFVFAILLSAWRGGFGAGLYATLATSLVIAFFFLPPQHSIEVYDPKQYFLFAIFIGQGIFVSALCASRLRNERLLYRAGNDLENRVAMRTNQLAQANEELKHEIQERSLLQEDLRKARDVAVESARLKSEFLANMSHEIRTPMNGVIGMTGLLLETPLNEDQRRFAQVIRGSGESLLTIINDILDFSKVEAGKLELETLDFDLRETVESLLEIFSSRAHEQHDELAALIHSDVPLALRGDAGRIRQILTNLIGNAIKFTKNGDILVRVEKLRESMNHVELKFSVTDSGEGISEQVQARLFQPFTQSDASTTRRFGGTGLGLSISKKLVEMMGGEIGLESKLGEGSTFWFKITFKKQEAVSHKNSEADVSPHYVKLSGKRVLIIDDNQINREVLRYQMRGWGMETVEAKDGLSALVELEKHSQPFDLIVLDLQMPFMDGMETAQKIAAGSVAPPIIVISSSGFKMDPEKMHQSKINAFLNKPYRQNDLLNAVIRVLDDSGGKVELDEDIHITAVPEIRESLPSKSRRILVVEDNTVNQMVAQNMLKNLGYHADVAANGREALAALKVIPYDLVLMDCQMPEMDGYEATREIRVKDWKAKNVPIIALTAHATAGEREKCLQAGMNDYLSKPVSKENLRQTLFEWLEKTHDGEPAVIGSAPSGDAYSTGEEVETVVSAVDFATLDDITDNDPEIKREVVETYLRQTVVNLSEIERAITFNDAQKLYEVAHRTVGGSALCGMKAIVEPMRKLEQLGREEKVAEAFPFFTQAQNALAEIDKECRANIPGI